MHELGRYLGNILHGYYGCDVLLINVGYLVPGEISGEFAGLLIECLIEVLVAHEDCDAAVVINEAFDGKFIRLVLVFLVKR